MAASQNSLLQFNAQNFGIPVTDEQAILGSLDKLCERARELIEVSFSDSFHEPQRSFAFVFIGQGFFFRGQYFLVFQH